MTLVIPSPAVGFAFGGEGTGVFTTSSNGLEASNAGWHLDGGWDARVSGGVVTQLAISIPSPAVGFAFGGEGAGVGGVGSNGLEADAGWQLDGGWD